MLNFFIDFLIFFLGLIVGSFLNCVIYRLEINKSFIGGRSFCPHCKHILSWQDLIPVFSFFVLGGKCRYCKKPISYHYPLVELATAILFILIFNLQFTIYNQFSIFHFFNFICYLIITCFLIVIFVYDLKHYIIPDKIIYPAITTAFLYRLFEILKFGFYNLDFKSLVNSVLSATLSSLFFLVIVLVSRGKWMGVGDVKLAFFMGLFLGWPKIFTALFSAFFIGAIVGLILIFLGKKRLSSEIPFGPFLIIGTFLSLFWGEKIIDLYLNLFLI